MVLSLTDTRILDMKKEILIITILITNIAFGAALPTKNRAVREIDTNKNRIKALSTEISRYLCNKGLEASAADKKVSIALQGDEHVISLMAQNIVEGFSEIRHEDIVAYIGSCALHERAVDLSSHDEIIALLQRSKRFQTDRTILEKVEKISAENKRLSSSNRRFSA